mmetsp:Transcript_22849/g.40666  ORF Transcript_22849/g.40666 Transcript_22849/m.40666 type:complete len:121 (+) Transcript_22849:943-1305(+)
MRQVKVKGRQFGGVCFSDQLLHLGAPKCAPSASQSKSRWLMALRELTKILSHRWQAAPPQQSRVREKLIPDSWNLVINHCSSNLLPDMPCHLLVHAFGVRQCSCQFLVEENLGDEESDEE